MNTTGIEIQDAADDRRREPQGRRCLEAELALAQALADALMDDETDVEMPPWLTREEALRQTEERKERILMAMEEE